MGKSRSLHLLPLLAAMLFIGAAAAAMEAPADGPVVPPHVDPYAMGPVAVVGPARVGADQVFELWTPIWYETLAKVRNGKINAGDGDAKLTEEWRRAITALVKDELFFQEAEREHASFLNQVVDNFLKQGDPRPRGQIANEIRKIMQQDMERYFRQLNTELIKESGGMVKLRKVLEKRGLTFMEWQNRLKKKAFTQSYLHQILKPRAPDPGPRQIQDYYASHTDEFAQPGLVRFRHIYFSNAKRGEEKAREDAVEVWQSIMDGVIDFEAAAAEFSDDGDSRERGGLESGEDASDPEREAWLADIRTALREENPGVVAPILESPFGCHVAILLSIGPERKVPFAEVRREIERKLQGKIWEAETDRYFLSVKKSTDIQVLMPNFPPHLSCSAQSGLDARSPTVYRTASPHIRSGAARPAAPER